MKYNIVVLFFIICLPVFGQKEVYFSDTVVANKKIESLQGIEVSAIPNKLDNSIGGFLGKHFNISGYIGYFYEAPIARTFSLKFTTGLHNVSYNKMILGESYDYYYNFNDYTYKRSYQAIFHIGAEPRWYYSFDKRYEIGKSKLNSGWFLGCPVSYEYSPIPDCILPHRWDSVNLYLTTYFLEADAGVGVERYLFAINKQFRFDYFVSAKIAYTF